MKFNSTTYLINSLNQNCSFEKVTIERFLKILNGFTVIPNSFSYDIDKKRARVRLSLPGSGLEMLEAAFDEKTFTVHGKMSSSGDAFFNYTYFFPLATVSLSVVLDDSTEYAGIYYFNYILGEQGRKECFYYDQESLYFIKEYARTSKSALKNFLGVTPDYLSTLGFLPDASSFKELNVDNAVDKLSLANEIIQGLTCELIINEAKKLNYSDFRDNEPISI